MNSWKKYTFGFDLGGLILFMIMMIPNLIWFHIPAPNDVLRVDSVTVFIDQIASIAQVITVATLCFLIHDYTGKTNKNYIYIVYGMLALYILGWIAYYAGFTNPFIIMILCICPSIALVMYSAYRKNTIAMIAGVTFTICHILYGIVNFIL